MGKNDERPYIGVDLGGTSIKTGVLDAKDRVTARAKSKTKAEAGSEGVLERIVKTVREAMEEAKLRPGDVGGVGIGAPGTIDIKKGVVVTAVNLRWNDFPLAKTLSKELDLPVTVDNDVNVGTWGEFVLGAGKDFEDILGVFIGTGIGGGLVLNGRLYHGHHMTAGEIGHTSVLADAPLGRRSLENMASRTAIGNLLAQLIRSNHPSKILDLVEGDLTEIRSKVISQAIEKGDDLAVRVVRESAHYVGVAIANVVTVMSLPCAVLGGGLTEELGKTYVEWVRASFEEHVFPSELRECKIVAGKLGDDAGVAGAALLARERLGKED